MDFDHLNHLAYDPYDDSQQANDLSEASFMPDKDGPTRKSSMSSHFSRQGADPEQPLQPLSNSPKAESYPQMHFKRSDTQDSSHPIQPFSQQRSPNFGQGEQGNQGFQVSPKPRKLTFGEELMED